MSTEGEACTWVTEFHYYPILPCLISNNSRCVVITRTYLLLHRLSQTGRENREESQRWMTASPQSGYLHDSQAIAQEQKLSKHHYRNALVSMAYFLQFQRFNRSLFHVKELNGVNLWVSDYIRTVHFQIPVSNRTRIIKIHSQSTQDTYTPALHNHAIVKAAIQYIK